MTPTEETVQETTAEAVEHTHDHDHEHHHHHAPTLNPELTRSISVEAPVEEVTKAFQQATKRYSKLARIPGFRAGKVPPTLIKSRFAKELRQEVLESLVSQKFREELEAQKLNPVSEPQLTELILNEGAPLKFTATFEVMPTVDITGYDTVTAEKPDTTLTDDEFQAELNNVLDHHATVEPVEEDRPLKDGDWAEIGFKGELQAVAQTVGEEGLEAQQEQPITGEDVLIEIGGKNTLGAFTEALRGAKVGQELEFEATYPAEFGDARLSGRTVKYDVTVKAIKSKTYPERDEEFAKTLGNYESWSDFETKLRERASDRKADALKSQARDKMLDEIVAKFNFPVPESFVQQQVDARLERGLRALAQQGMSADAMRQLDFARLREAQRDQAVTEVKVSMLLDKIAEQEKIEVSDEELERELLMLSLQSREPLESLHSRMKQDGTLNRMKDQIRREKTGVELYERLAK